jgi:hypothetical protein
VSPEGTLYITGPDVYWREVALTLYQVYPGVLYSSQFADEEVSFGLNVPFPVGPVYTRLSVLAEYGFSGSWLVWNEVQPYLYSLEQAQWAF